MANKFKVTFTDGCESLHQSLGIKQDRAEELDYRLRLIIHDMEKPVRSPEEGPSSDQFIKLCIALAENEQELAFCAYVAGMKVKELWNTEEEEYDFLNDEYEEED